MTNDNTSWQDVERLISDLKSDGYTPSNIETSTSHAAPTKTLFIDVARLGDSDE
jgi:hypothetical protein